MDIVLFAYTHFGFRALEYCLDNQIPVRMVVVPKKDLDPNNPWDSVFRLSEKAKIPIFIFEDIKTDFELFRELQEPYAFLLGFPYIISPEMIKIFMGRMINFHGGILPSYKGCLSGVWSIINSEKYAGLSAHFINQKVDEGDIINIKKTLIKKDDTGFSLYHKIIDLALIALQEIIDNLIKTGSVSSFPQNVSEKSMYHGRELPNNGILHWNNTSEYIYNFTRAFFFPPFPPACCAIKGKKIFLLDVEPTDILSDAPPGTIIKVKPAEVMVATKDRNILIKKFTFDFKNCDFHSIGLGNIDFFTPLQGTKFDEIFYEK